MVYNRPVSEVRRTAEFTKWLKGLRDAKARARVALRVKRIELTGNLGDYKPLGDGVSELRVDYGPGYRLYFSMRGDVALLLLVGGDKSSQQRDIERAKKINAEYE